ncbi:MAG TPA: hypothetical protein VKF59_23215 [Candidatus Dormibacteraeota bacterium]|nr:hypothetical protein [Candidatus Dormibacteraeota bacterium]
MLPTSKRALAAAAALVGALLLQPGPTGRAGLDDSAGPDCPAASGLPQITGRVLAFTGTLSCFRPGGASFGGTVTRPTVAERLPNPVPGAPCRDINYYPVTFTEAGGAVRATFHARAGSSTAVLEPAAAAMAATHEAMVSDVLLGSYQLEDPTDPASPLTCRLDPAARLRCPDTGQLDSLCFIWIAHPITPASSPPAAWAPFFAAAAGDIRAEAGTIGSSPAATAVVNTPVCSWIDGMGIPSERDLTLILAGRPDPSGRQVFYTFVARIRFDHVNWFFDDYSGSTATVQPPSACGAHPELVAHSYSEISDDRHPDHRFHVVATEIYTIDVQVFWIDSDGSHRETVDPGLTIPPVELDPHPQYVGQVEGVPLGGP